MDVNVTTTGSLKGVRIGINYTTTVLTVASVAFSNPVAIDVHIKYVNTTTSQTHWNPGNFVVYDADSSNKYSAGDTIISGTPTIGNKLKTDLKMKYVDANGSSVWNAGESVFYDVLNLGTFVPGDTLLTGPVPGLFDGVGISNPVHTISNTVGFIDYAIVDIDTSNPTVSGVGVILRITFNVVSASGSSTIRINLGSSLSNPGPVP